MPKIHKAWSDSIVYCFKSQEDARNASLTDNSDWAQKQGRIDAKAATGFVVEVPGPRRCHHYVVTCRHVINPGGLLSLRFSFSGPDGQPYVLNTVEDDWFLDLLPTDLAVLPIPDASALPTVQGIRPGMAHPGDPEKDLAFGRLTADVGDDVVMLGRFYPSSGGARNRPLARFGNLACWPSAQIVLPWISYDPIDVILVEMRSHSGYSGSPVFAFGGLNEALNYSHARNAGYETPIEADWREIKFIGVDCGHLAENMAIVIPWYKLLELLHLDELVNQRAALEQAPGSPDPSSPPRD